MRILFLTHHFLPRHRGGVETYTLGIARELVQLGHEVTVLTTDDGVPLGSLRKGAHEGIPLLGIGHDRVVKRWDDTLGRAPVLRALERAIAGIKPEIVHAQHLMYVGLDALRIARSLGHPTVLTLHEYWLLCARGGQFLRTDGEVCEAADVPTCAACLQDFKFGRTPWEGKVARWCRHLGATGDSLFSKLKAWRQRAGTPGDDSPAKMRELEAWLHSRASQIDAALGHADSLLSPSLFLKRKFEEANLHGERILYWPNGVGDGGISSGPRNGGDPALPLRVGFMGSIMPSKGPLILAQAHSQMRPGLIRVTYHGSMKSHPEYAEQVRSVAPDDESTFPGPFPGGKASEILEDLDVLVVPSTWYENSPVVISEARTAQVPVVASNLGGMAEQVRDGVDGRLFESRKPADLARVLEELAENPQTMRTMAQHAPSPKTVAEDARALLEMYREILKRRGAGS